MSKLLCAEKMMALSPTGVAAKELTLRHCIGETLLISIYTQNGNLIKVP